MSIGPSFQGCRLTVRLANMEIIAGFDAPLMEKLELEFRTYMNELASRFQSRT